MSTVGSDIVVASDTSIGFRATIGSSVVCSANIAGNTFAFPPATLNSGQVLTAGRATPGVGDVIAVYNDGPTTGRTDDRWSIYTIRNVTNPVGSCVAPFMAAGDLLRQAMVIAVNEGISLNIVQGAPVRFLRQIDYRLYTASDGKAYLGYMECPMSGGGMCSTLQPVSGPYRRFVGTGNTANGLQIQYFDSLNTEISGAQLAVRANLNNVARLRVSVRGETANAMAVPGLPRAPKQDELTVHVGVRNRQ